MEEDVRLTMLLRRHRVDQRDVQGNVLCGYGNDFAYGRYLFVRVTDPPAGRRWLRELCEQVTDAVPWPNGNKPQQTLNVALTHAGLRAVGVPEPVLATFPKEFRDGMSERSLGDTGDSARENWEPELVGLEVLVTVMAQDEQVLERRLGRLRERVTSPGSGLDIAYEQQAGLLGNPDAGPGEYAREHFGFADGFSQPSIRGNAGPETRKGMGTPGKWGRWRPVAPGEFVLGYRGEDGLPPAAPAAPLGHSGSFMVWRKLEQHVLRFRKYLREAAQRELACLSGGLALPGDPEGGEARLAQREEVLAAKMVGRWLDGRSLVVSERARPDADGRSLDPEQINRFRYRDDPDGLRCPLGAHVRRANPRDGLGWEGRPVKLHRIIRRGMPYGPPFANQEPDGDGDSGADRAADRGLIFICYQASIARQFELIQKRWLNDGDPFWLGSEQDFLTPPGAERGHGDFEGDDEPAGARMTIQGHPPSFLAPPPPLVTTRGGDYFFTPGLSALRALANAYWR